MKHLMLGALVVLAFALGFWLRGPSTAEHEHDGGSTTEAAEPEIWTCSMHPNVRQDEFGSCPLCGMDLTPLAEESTATLGDWELELSDRARALASIETAPVERRFVDRELRLVGRVAHDQKEVGVIAARVAGRVDRLYADFKGAPVTAGDHLVELYSPGLIAAQQEFLSAAKSHAAMAGDPAQQRRVVRRLDAARDKLRLLGLSLPQIEAIAERGEPSETLTIYAHISGTVMRKHVVQGQYVKEGDPLFTLTNHDQLWVMLDAYERDLPWLQFGQTVRFSTTALPSDDFEGRIVFIDPMLDPVTRTVGVRLNVINDRDLLKPDMFVSARVQVTVGEDGRAAMPSLAGKWVSPMHPEIIKDEPGVCDVCGMSLVKAEQLGLGGSTTQEPALVIPATAPLITGERAVVYVETEPGRYQGREIGLGPRADAHYIVLSGLEEGERVVVRGAFTLDSEMQIRARSSMMYPPERPPERLKTSAVFETQIGAVLDTFFALQAALSLDDDGTAKTAAERMATAIAAVDAAELDDAGREQWIKLDQEMDITAVVGASDLATRRRIFEPLSAAMSDLVAIFGAAGRGVYQFHCPMAFDNRGADWLQNTDAIANPYFGSMMFACGSLVETINEAEDE